MSDSKNRTLPIRGLEEEGPTEATVVIPNRRRSEQRSFVTLRVVSGNHAYRVCAVYEGERVVVGRDSSADLVMTDPSISRRHMAVMCRADGVFVDDLGSSNGTRYLGCSVSRPTPVEVGDDIQVGQVLVRVERLSLDELSGLAKLRARLNESDRDPLCGVLSRRHMEEVLPEQLRGYREAKIVVSGCFVDVDGFSKINESQGHTAGDRVLRRIASVLEDSMRTSDEVIRLGGDQFFLVLLHCTEVAAFQLAERLRGNIETHDWSRLVEGPCQPFRVTVSLGVAEYQGEELRKWLSILDRALGDAKAGGRNTIRSASRSDDA